jgi:hypothetical protein
MNWLSLMANPKTHAVKKMMYEFLKDKYPAHDQIIERLSTAMQTEGDIQAFFKMVVDIYEKGYIKSVDDHKEQLAKAGISVRVVPSK